MKHKFFILILFATSAIQAQVKQVTIIDKLEAFVPGEGIIQISCDPKIAGLIGTLSPDSVDQKSYVKTSGFRIQVFMSNDPKAAKVVVDKGSLIKITFPEITVYPVYVAPNWKLLAGDFMTKDEADVFKQKLQKSIPELGKEMYVVPDKVNIPIQKNN